MYIIGQAYRRVFFFQEKKSNGVSEYHHKINVPGGAAALHKIINNKEILLDNSYRQEYYELKCFEKSTDNLNNGYYYAVTRHIGIQNGDMFLRNNNSNTSNDSIVYIDGNPDCNVDFKHPKSTTIKSLKNAKTVMWVSSIYLPELNVFNKIAKKCFLMISADLLRINGAMISKSISWERSAENLLWQLAYNPHLVYLLRAPYIFVTFSEDGAIYIKTKDGKLSEAWLTLQHNGLENTLRNKIQGKNDDAFLLMVAAVAQQFTDVMLHEKILAVRPVLNAGAKMIQSGYQLEELSEYRYKVAVTSDITEPDGVKIPIDRGVPIKVNQWVIACDKSKNNMYSLANNFIITGEIAENDFPMLSIGKLMTIDRGEIEAYSNISNLINNYYTTGSPEKPLCIAVFGKPGSGKSFGVKQIAENVLPDNMMETLIFNTSQFINESDLGPCFQRVRDIALRGKIPLVFFDEFDSDGRKWLKSFLMPMQDGIFKDENGEHPLGKCILVFAGGTAFTFEEFRKLYNTDDGKDKKIPDFISRIKGSIDIVGPNPRSNDDETYILRRALLIRSMCKQDDRLFDNNFIDSDIIRALLLVPEFFHGVRSMETILAKSDITFGRWVPATLPLGDLLSAHVDTRSFTDLLLFDVIMNSEIGVMAQKIHEFYLSHQNSNIDKNQPSNVSWADLPWHFKLDNLNAARAYPQNLAKLGGRIGWQGEGSEILDLTDKSIIEQLAMEEHNRWWENKKNAGWKPGKPRDDINRIHDCMYRWEYLDEKTKEKNRNTVREIPFVLNAVGKCVYKAPVSGISRMQLNTAQIETIAETIHEDYRKANPGNLYDVPWGLPEEIRQINRNQAVEFISHLEFLGLSLYFNTETDNIIEQLNDEQIEIIAERIHEVWMNNKKEAGWIFGHSRDEIKKMHPSLISFNDLSEYEKEKDRIIARSIVPLLKTAGIVAKMMN